MPGFRFKVEGKRGARFESIETVGGIYKVPVGPPQHLKWLSGYEPGFKGCAPCFEQFLHLMGLG